MSFHVQKWRDISNGWSDIPSKKEANEKGGEKTMGGKIGRKKRKKKEEKRKKKRRSQQNKRKEREKEGGEIEGKTERKKSWDQVFNKHLKSAAFSHPPISTILDFALEFITGCFWIPYGRIPSYSVQLKLIWKLRPFIIWVPHPLSTIRSKGGDFESSQHLCFRRYLAESFYVNHL